MPEATFPLVPRGRIVGLSFGAMRSARRGTGSDVAGSRPYSPGDDVKAIDWAASARLSSARGDDEFIVRELYAEQAPRVVVVCDRRPEMRLFPSNLPWLRKAEAQRNAIELIRASTVDAHGFLGYLDFGDGSDEPFWLPPQSQSLWEFEEREDAGGRFDAPAANVEQAMDFLVAHPRSVPAGTFVFVLSDFLVPPPPETWLRALEQRWDVIPVVLQDRSGSAASRRSTRSSCGSRAWTATCATSGSDGARWSSGGASTSTAGRRCSRPSAAPTSKRCSSAARPRTRSCARSSTGASSGARAAGTAGEAPRAPGRRRGGGRGRVAGLRTEAVRRGERRDLARAAPVRRPDPCRPDRARGRGALDPLVRLFATVQPPEPTYRLGSTTLGLLFFAAALACLGAAAVVSRPIVAELRARRARREGYEATPLERAVELVELTARRHAGEAEHREALGRLARELRQAGMREVAPAARRLAWSEDAPSRSESDELTRQVRAATEEAA